MKLLLSWLKDFIDLKNSPKKIGEKIFIHTLNVEKIDEDRKAQDAFFDIEVTPDRGDCLSHLGIARELGVIFNKNLKTPIQPKFSEAPDSRIKIDVKEKKLCPRYSARVISKVRIKESPQWLRNRLVKLGALPINNIVDVTNYIMLSYGQPMHAFDLDKIKCKKIIVRSAHKNEKIFDLDNREHILSKNDLLISDVKNPIAIAGVFGSLNSGISKNTKDIVLESAFFDAIKVRLTSKRLNLSTEASYRFERGTDIEMTVNALDYATELILHIAGGKAQKKVDIYNKFEPRKIKINHQKINKLLGIKISDKKIDEILTNLGFKIINSFAIVPSWRSDILILEDLIEEIGRIYGYNKLPKTKLGKMKFDNMNSTWMIKEQIKDILVEIGLTEVYNYSFVSESDLNNFKIKKDPQNKLINPLSPECAYMRPNMLIGLIKTIAKNPSFDPIEIFEIGEIFRGNSEKSELAIATCGHKSRMIDKIIVQLSKVLNLSIKTLRKISKTVNIDQTILRKYKIRKPKVEIFGVSIDDLLCSIKFPKTTIKLQRKDLAYKEISKFPSIQRDLAIIVNAKTRPEKIKTQLIKEELIKTVDCFDQYVSDKFGKNKKSLAFRINYASNDRTLNKSEINLVQKKLLLKLKNKFGAELRTS